MDGGSETREVGAGVERLGCGCTLLRRPSASVGRLDLVVWDKESC